MSPEARTATAADITDATTFDFPYKMKADGVQLTFKCRRLNMLTQLMEDVVNAPLFAAASTIIAQVGEFVRESGVANDSVSDSVFMNLQPEQKSTMLDQLRRYACATIIEPRFVMGTPGPGESPVQLLDADTLFRLWNFDPSTGAPRLSEVAAATFPAAVTGVDSDPSNVEGVRTTPVGVAARR